MWHSMYDTAVTYHHHTIFLIITVNSLRWSMLVDCFYDLRLTE